MRWNPDRRAKLVTGKSWLRCEDAERRAMEHDWAFMLICLDAESGKLVTIHESGHVKVWYNGDGAWVMWNSWEESP